MERGAKVDLYVRTIDDLRAYYLKYRGALTEVKPMEELESMSDKNLRKRVGGWVE